ncbi:MAG: hypothetical protein HYY23_16700 [Verrucomicrobia bacterium]|nr:hypothetical protein [Verrucomicrobiota bacterium]
MRIVHRIFSNGNAPFKVALDALGIRYNYEESIVGKTVSLEVSEDEAHWQQVSSLLSQHQIHDYVYTKFTKEEIRAAEWLVLGTTGHFGYPQPEDRYVETTYDIQAHCQSCGIGKHQKAPFRFRSEPKASRCQFLQLNWVFDEFFVRLPVKEEFERHKVTGVRFQRPVIHKTGREIESVFQICVGTLLPPALATAGLRAVTCKLDNEEWSARAGQFSRDPDASYCGRIKYHPPTRELFRFLGSQLRSAPDVVKSHEWFGSGASAYRVVLVSRRVASIFEANRWRGVTLKPVELVQ